MSHVIDTPKPVVSFTLQPEEDGITCTALRLPEEDTFTCTHGSLHKCNSVYVCNLCGERFTLLYGLRPCYP